MKKMLPFLALSFLIAACSTITLSPANFAWPIENVATTDADGNISIDRYSTEFNASNLFKTEFGDSTNVANRELRIIRDNLGYYLMTSKGFINVYVFEVSDGAFIQKSKVFITKEGLKNPVLNQRSPKIELIDGDKVYSIDSKGLIRK